jgi:AcrR family transcriptional regulator
VTLSPHVESADASVAHLLEAACRTISKRGFVSTRVVDIADEAGVSAATVHYHFKTRQEILLDALLWANARLVDEFRDFAEDKSPLLRMTEMLEQMIPYPGPREDGYRLEIDLWSQARHYPELQQAYAQFGEYWLREVTSSVEEGVQSGNFRISSEPSEIAERLLSFSDGLAVKAVWGDARMDPDRIRRLLVAFAAEQLGVEEVDLERHPE